MTRSIADSPVHQIPVNIARRLAQLTRRAKGVVAARGAAYTLGAFLVAMMLAVAIDVFVPMLWPAAAMWFTPASRIAITATVLAVTLGIAFFFLIRPLRHRYSLTAAAMTLERSFPELQERISTTVELMLSGDPAVFRGSDQMIEHVARSADADSSRVSPKQVIVTRRARRAWLAAGAVVLIVAGAAAWQPAGFSLYVQRFVVPWNKTAQFRRTRVESLTGDGVVPRMEQLVIEARSTGLRAARATIYLSYLDGDGAANGRSATMVARGEDEDGGRLRFRFVIPRVQESFTYRIRANDGVTRAHTITAVDRPQVDRLDMLLHYPDYTGLPDRLQTGALGPVSALRHTRVTVRLSTNRTLDTDGSFLVVEGTDRPTTQPDAVGDVRRAPLTRIGRNEYQAAFAVLTPGHYHFEMVSGGLGNLVTPDRRYAIMPEADGPPQVKILTPPGQVSLRPDDKLPVGYEARDDFRVSAAQISYSIDGGAWRVLPIEKRVSDTLSGERVSDTLSGASRGPKRVKARTVFDLSGLGADLSAALRVDYQVQVADNLPAKFGGPQWAASARRQILIDPKASDYEARLAETLRETFADTVQRIDRELRAALADVQRIQKAMVRQPRMDAPQSKYTDTAIAHLAKANELAVTAAGKTEFSNYERMGARLGEIATGHIQPARDLTGQSRELGEKPDPRKDKLQQAEWHIQRALEKLNLVGREFTDLINLEKTTDELFDMAAKQEEIAEDVAGEEITDPKELAELTKEQLELLAKARELLKAQKAEAAEPLFDIATEAEKTINEMIREIAEEQTELIEEAGKAEELSNLERKVKDLARRQKQLADSTAAFEKSQAEPLAKVQAPREADKPMARAAEKIDRQDFPTALAEQKQASQQLDKVGEKVEARADQVAGGAPAEAAAELNKQRREVSSIKQMAARARQLQKQQQDLAKQTQTAKVAAEQADRKADAAAQPADRQLADLAKRQEAIAAKAEQLQKDAAAKLTPADAQAAKQRDATPSARQSADYLKKKNPAAASPQGQYAQRKAGHLAGAMDQAAAAHHRAAQQAARKAAAAKDAAARQAAQAQAAQHNRQAADARQIAAGARKVAAEQAALNRQLPQARQLAVRAAQAAAAAGKPKRQLADLAKRQQAVAAAAGKLQKQMAEASKPAAKLAAEHDAAKPAGEAAGKLPAKPAEAAAPQQRAAAEFGELAKGLDALVTPATEKVARTEQAHRQARAVRRVAAGAEALKRRQDQLAEETRKLGEDLAKARGELVDRQLADLAEKQQELAQRAGELADNVARQPADEQGNPQPATPNPAATRAAAAAEAAAENLGEGKLPPAAAQQRQAQGQLEQLAGQLAEQANQQAGVDPQAQQIAAAEAGEAGRLAEQQKQLAEQLDHLMKRDPLANLPARQDALRQQTEQVGEQAKLVAEFMRELAPQAGELARQAAAQVAQRAPAAQAQAVRAMQQNQMAQARRAQQQAVAAAEKAEELFNRAAEQAAATAEPAPPGEDEQPLAEQDPEGEPGEGEGQGGRQEEQNPYDPLAQAAWAQAQAQQAMKDALAAQQAQQRMAQAVAQAQAALAAQQAGQKLSQAAQGMARQVISMAMMPSAQPGDRTELYMPSWYSRFGSRGGAPDLRRLNFQLGITSTEWNRLPGYIQQEVIQASREKVPQEYRELIKRYFQTISQQAGQR